jgi:hypothetical protein
MFEIRDLYWLIGYIEYIGYYNFIIGILILYIAYYLLSNTFMFILFLGIGIAIGMYLSYAMRNTLYMV